jgi:signal peptidase I
MDKKTKKLLKKVWHFIWEDDSIWSWIVNIILAFVLIKFIVYPGLGFLLGTTHPVVAVVSSSMEHRSLEYCTLYKNTEVLGKKRLECVEYEYIMCGNSYDKKKSFNLDEYWDGCGGWYESNVNISKDEFRHFSFKNGFNKGDIMVLTGKSAEQIEEGDVIVFMSSRKDPIIHRVVKKMDKDNELYFQTKGDNNKDSIENSGIDETKINESMIIGKAVFRIPLLGYIKIWFVELLQSIGVM